jgi:hypothetical protein
MQSEIIFMKSYVNPGEQLVVALYVRNIKKSSEFYRSYGFEVVRDEGTFMELRWEDARLFLSAVPDTPPPPTTPIGNMRARSRISIMACETLSLPALTVWPSALPLG